MVYQRYKNTERKKMYHDGRRRKIQENTVFTAAAALFFIAGIITEFYLKKTDMHVSDYLGNFIWNFKDSSGFESCAVFTDFILAVLRGLCRPALCLILVFLCGFTVYAPAVAFTASAYSAFTFGALCTKLAEKEISYLIFAVICSSILITLSELCVYSAYLGRELARRSPPSARLLTSLPEVKELFRLTGIAAFKLAFLIAVYYAVIPYF